MHRRTLLTRVLPFTALPLIAACGGAVAGAAAGVRDFTLKQFGKYSALVRLPAAYDPAKRYKIFLGLSGGDQNRGIVDYCAQVYFTSKLLDEYIIIAPINQDGRNFAGYQPDDIAALFGAITTNFPATENGWLIAGTSNGGVAAFQFLAADPARFQGIITMPGALADLQPTADWQHLQVLLAVGTADSDYWLNAADQAEQLLRGKTAFVRRLPLNGEGHILPTGYPIDNIYRAYFAP